MSTGSLDTQTRRPKSCLEWFKGAQCLIYVDYFLSSWGDRMWHFAVGLYLVILSGGVLRLAAILGLGSGVLILLFGGVIGHWVDITERMKVIRLTLCIQNTCVSLCASVVCALLYWEDDVDGLWDGWLRVGMEVTIIVLAMIAELASVGYKVSVEKDWIVVVAQGNKSLLANLNAVTRTLNLICKVFAPCLTGLIMFFFSKMVAAIVIAVWNIVSMGLEYLIMRKIYHMVPELQHKKHLEPEIKEVEMETLTNSNSSNGIGNGTVKTKAQEAEEDKESKSCLDIICSPFTTVYSGWRIYASQKVVYAGVSLGLLYMTVLGFDSITLGYLYAQGINETIVGISMGLAGITGIMGAYCFTRFRKWMGLEKTGICSYNFQVFCLILALVSVWLPGSPMDLNYADKHAEVHDFCYRVQSQNASLDPFYQPTVTNFTLIDRMRRSLIQDVESFTGNAPQQWSVDSAESSHLTISLASRQRRSIHGYDDLDTSVDFNELDFKDCVKDNLHTEPESYMSAIFFITGIVVCRIGLWMNDLVVTQLLQENVPESQRGTVGGVQNSLNYFVDMVKFILVILLPHIETFGILVILSFIFVWLASVLFMFHAYRTKCGRTLRSENSDDENSEVKRPLNDPESSVKSSPEKTDKNDCDV